MTYLAELADMTFGFAFKSVEFTENPDDVRLLRGDNIGQGRLRWNGVKRFPSNRISDLERYCLTVGDVVIAMDRPWIEAGLKYSVVRPEDVPSLLVQRVARLRAKGGLDQGYLAALIGSKAFTNYVIGVQTGSAVPHISGGQIGAFEVGALPSLNEQHEIAATLGRLDEKIESNRRSRKILRQLGAAELASNVGARHSKLQDMVISISRGVAPKYADNDPAAPLVLNQKCIRDNWVSAAAARHMKDRNVAEAKRANSGDILVNSTGTGTLGRVGRWHHGNVFVDGHVSIVKPDPDKIGPTVLAYLLFGREADIADMATGSTGQTELNAARLGQLDLAVPSSRDVRAIEPLLLTFEDRAASLNLENIQLTAVRNTLLPELLSGRIRVPEVCKTLNEAVV